MITRLLTIFETYDSVEEAVGEATAAYAGLNFSERSLTSLGTIDRFLGRT